ncbi:MAG: ribosome recycling factor [Oscillospiraceae bacterium]|nr:ribosome recycling factor [Oscillospiraceae bacterium]
MANQELKVCEEKMQKTMKALANEFGSIRAGRANPAVLDKITVDYYDTPTPINQVAAISVAEARVLVIQPWDASILKGIEKAIQASDLGINPANDGKVLRISFPPLTEERRKELCKQIKKYGEESKVAVRSIRRDTIEAYKKLEKASEITEDDLKNAEKKIQDLTDKFCKEVDTMTAAKEKEILEL